MEFITVGAFGDALAAVLGFLAVRIGVAIVAALGVVIAIFSTIILFLLASLFVLF